MLRWFWVMLVLAPGVWAQEHLGRELADWRADLDSAGRLERLLAARAIGEMAIAGRSGAAETLFEALSHRDSAVRYWAAAATGEMGERAAPARERLREALADPAPEVRCWAAYALAELGHEGEALAALIRELGNAEKGARLQAAHALDALGTRAQPAAEALKRAVEDEFDYVQRVARHALWVLGERACPYRECE